MKSLKPLVVIVVLNWNGREDSEKCLASLRSVDYTNFRTLLVDNGSTDGSVDHLKARFPEVEFIETGRNLGYAEGNNVGIRRALGMDADYVLLLNNDTTVQPDFLRVLVEEARRDDGIGVIGPQINRMDPTDRISFAGGVVNLWWGYSRHIGNHLVDRGQFIGTIDQDYQTGAAMMLSRELLEKVGMLDAEFVSYSEDSDLCLRAKRTGFRVVCCRDALIYHKVSASTGGGLTPFKAYRRVLCSAKLYRRYAGLTRCMTTVAAFNAVYVGATVLVELLRGRLDVVGAILRGFWDLAHGRDRHREALEKEKDKG